MSEEQPKSLGEIAYDAFTKALGQPGYSIGGFPVRNMRWEKLSEHQQNAWESAAEAAIFAAKPDMTVEEDSGE